MSRFAAPRAVTFDCWNTLLYETDPGHGFVRRVERMVALLADAGHTLTLEEAADVLGDSWHRHAQRWAEGESTGAPEVSRWALEALQAYTPALDAALTQVLQDVQSDDGTAALEGARETLVKLRERGIRRALVCDTGLTPGTVVRRLLDQAGLLDELEVLVFSDEQGVPKPHAKVFHAALGPFEVEPAHAVHVGDLRRSDIAGARGVGMGTIRITAIHDDRSEHPEADAVVEDHAALRELLGC
jgi:putative hydrolase of the HAD superfamily